ncbi:MAG: PQQ-binding-like beta-propeller repeat protein [Proteobacteria bacterium]|nr:PQQ-binding-like beta-propeller repeat protein [Pseudomonadota bacterium]
MKKILFPIPTIFLLLGFLLVGACSKECDPSSFRVERLDPPEKCSASIPNQHFSGLAVSKEGNLYLTSRETFSKNEGDSSKLLHCLYILNRDCQPQTGINIKSDFMYEVNPAIGENGDIYILSGENTKDEKTIPFLNSISSVGKLNWIVELENLWSTPSLAIDSLGNIYVNGGNNLFSVSGDGKIKWSRTFQYLGEGIIAGPDDNLYVNESNGTVHKISQDGNVLWSVDLNDFSWEEGELLIKDMAMDKDGMIYLQCFIRGDTGDGYHDHYLIKLNSQGDILWRVPVGFGTFNGPPAPLLIGPETVYVQITPSLTDSLFAFNLNDGSLKWTLNQDGWPGVIDKESNVYATTPQGLMVIDSEGSITSVNNTNIMPWLIDQDGFIYYYKGPFKISYSESDGYYQSGWSMINHDPQNTNRWNGGS